MEKTLQSSFVGFFEIFHFEMIGIRREFGILPAIHKFIGMLSIDRSELPVYKI